MSKDNLKANFRRLYGIVYGPIIDKFVDEDETENMNSDFKFLRDKISLAIREEKGKDKERISYLVKKHGVTYEPLIIDLYVWLKRMNVIWNLDPPLVMEDFIEDAITRAQP